MSPQSKDQDDGVADTMLELFAASAGAATAALALGSGTAGAAVGAAVPPLAKLMRKLGHRGAEWGRLREERVVQLTAARMGGLNIFEDRLNDPERFELYCRVVRASGRSIFGEKIDALARVLHDGLKEGGSAQEALALVAVIDDLEAPHVLLLHHLKTSPIPPQELRRPGDDEPRGWEVGHLERADPNLAVVVGGVAAVLVGHGLIRDVGGVTYLGSVGPPVYQLAPLGRRCLLLLTEPDVDDHQAGT